MKEKLIVTRNFLYRLFLIGIIFNVLFQVLFLAIGGKGLSEASRVMELPPYYLIELIIVSITAIRAILFYFILHSANIRKKFELRKFIFSNRREIRTLAEKLLKLLPLPVGLLGHFVQVTGIEPARTLLSAEF